MAKLSRFYPPGYDQKSFFSWFYSALFLCMFRSFEFLISFITRYNQLFSENHMLQNPGTMMHRFDYLIENALSTFPVLAICMLPFAFFNYAYFHRESKSIYTMRRVKNTMELHIRCWALPVSAALVFLIVAFMLYWIYLAIYMAFTPAEFMPAQYIPMIGRYLP